MWFFGAKFVYGCEKGYPGGAFHKSFLTRLRTKPNVTMIRDNVFNLPTEIIQTVEVFWVCIGVGAGNIISHILKHSPSATIFHLAVENNQPELLKARNLGIRTYNI